MVLNFPSYDAVH